MKELDRLQVMTRIAERRLTRRRAAELLGLSERHVRRLYDAFAADGASSLTSRRRGRPRARRLAAATRECALALIRERYADFGPTFAHQKLTEDHALTLSVETLRGWMIAAEIWVPRLQRARRSYTPRVRRACLGEARVDGLSIPQESGLAVAGRRSLCRAGSLASGIHANPTGWQRGQGSP